MKMKKNKKFIDPRYFMDEKTVLIKEELQKEIEPRSSTFFDDIQELETLDEGLGDLLKSVGNLFNSKYRQFKVLAKNLGDTAQFWGKAKPVIEKDGITAAKETASGKGRWHFTSYINNRLNQKVHIWKILARDRGTAGALGFGLTKDELEATDYQGRPDQDWEGNDPFEQNRQIMIFHGINNSTGPLNLTPGPMPPTIRSARTKKWDIDLSDIYSNGVKGDLANTMIYLAETVDVLAALTALMDAGTATQATVEKVEHVRRFIAEEIADLKSSSWSKLTRLQHGSTRGSKPSYDRPQTLRQKSQAEEEAMSEARYGQATTWEEGADRLAGQISDADKKNFKAIQEDIGARFTELLGQAKKIETKLVNLFRTGALQAELPRSAPELQEQKNKIVINVRSSRKKQK